MAEALITSGMQCLRFELGGENYAFDVLKTREVLFLVKITPLPSAMEYLAGVINLRGSVIPIIDLKKKFKLPETKATEDTAIIIIEVMVGSEMTLIGALVDGVRGVLRLEPGEMEAPPRFGLQMNVHLVRAIAKKDGNFMVILDSDQVFSERELWLVQEVQNHDISQKQIADASHS